MISYVRPFCSRPCWWMPASCANALRPTTALFGWGKTPMTWDRSWLVRKISFAFTPHLNATACERTRPAITISSSAALPARSPMPLIVHSTWPAPGAMDRRLGASEAVGAADLKLVLEVEVRRGDEDVHPRSRGRPQRLPGEIDVAVVAPRQRRHRGPSHGFGHAADGLLIALGRAR